MLYPQSPPPLHKVGDEMMVFGFFNGDRATCTFYFQNRAYATTIASSVSASQVECPVPRPYVASEDMPIPECAPVQVSVRVWSDSASALTANPDAPECSSDRNRGPPASWSALVFGDDLAGAAQAFRYKFDDAQTCAEGAVPACTAFGLKQEPAMLVRPGEAVHIEPAAGDSFGDFGYCSFFSAHASNDGMGDFFTMDVPATRVEDDMATCVVPHPPPGDNGYACGMKVYLVFTTFNHNDNPTSNLCRSDKNGDRSASTSDGETMWTVAGNNIPNAARAFMYSCDTPVDCTTVPQIDGASPTVGLEEGDVIDVTSIMPDTFSADNARCLWWYNGNAYRLYENAITTSSSMVQCRVPSRVITFGPDAGTTIPPCGTVHVTIQSWPDAVTNPQDNQCFSHEGQTMPHWAPTDSVAVSYSCENDGDGDSDCLEGPFGMTWYNGDILVANEGRGGGGVSISRISGPAASDAGAITTPWLAGLNGPSGLAWLSSPSDLLITDDTDGGRIHLHDTFAGTTSGSWGVGAGASPLPGQNPNAIRTNAAGEAIVAFAGSGVIAKYTTSGGYCVLATGVATPQAVEIHDGENKVWFTDSNINLFEVSMGPTGGCPASPPSCSAVPDCNGVAVGMDAVGSGAHTEGGLIKAGDNFYMSDYGGDQVLIYTRGSSPVSSVCVSGVSQARGLLIDTQHIYITSYNTDSVYRAELDCTNLELFADGECPELPESDHDEGACIAEELFYYKGLVLSKMCGSGCDASRPALTYTKADGEVVKYFEVGNANDMHMRRCIPTPP